MTESVQVKILGELESVSRAIADHSRRVMQGESADWASVADRLATATRLCRSQVVRKLTDIGDSGGR